jgi:ubiquinone biosynthesis accessory factor UbiK
MSTPTPPNLDDLIDRVLNALPEGLHDLRQDTEKNLRAALRSTLSKMNLVTREEFDIQRGVLARSRAKLDALEKQVAELEKQGRGKVEGS